MRCTRTVPLTPIRLRAEMSASDAKLRRAQATIYSGRTMDRFDLFDGHYTLRLAMDGADLSRLNSGAPLTRDHSPDLDAVVGVVERAWIAKGEALATVRFSDREDVGPLWADVQAGIVKNVSMDVALLELEDVTPKGGEKALLAKKWQPLRLAIVSAGADPGAQMTALSDDADKRPCRIRFNDGGENMRKRKKCPSCNTALAADYAEKTCPSEECGIDFEDFDAERDELARVGRIHQLATSCELGDVWAQRHIKGGTSIADARDEALRLRAEREPHINGSHNSTGAEYDSPGFKLEQMTEGLAARARGVAPTEIGRRYAHASLVEMGLEILGWRGHHRGLDVRRDAGRIAQLMLTTSDYPLLLANTGSKLLAVAYTAADPVYRLLARRQDLRDFKVNSYLKVGDFPTLLEVGEAGEITLGSFSESGETWALATYGRITNFSRQAIINDDLNAFHRMMQGAGQRAAQVENAIFFTLLTAGTSNNGPTLADTVQFFASAAWPTGHANLASSGTAIDVTTLGAGRAAMQKQTSLDGLKLNLIPKFLLTSPDKRTIAEQYTTQITPALPSSVNPFPGRLEVVSDANLPSANPWYLFADPGSLPAAVYGHLEGAIGPRIESRVGFEVEGLQLKCAIDFAVACVEPRAAWRNPGA